MNEGIHLDTWIVPGQTIMISSSYQTYLYLFRFSPGLLTVGGMGFIPERLMMMIIVRYISPYDDDDDDGTVHITYIIIS